MYPLVLLEIAVIAIAAATVDGGPIRNRFDLTELRHARFRFAFVTVTCRRVYIAHLICNQLKQEESHVLSKFIARQFCYVMRLAKYVTRSKIETSTLCDLFSCTYMHANVDFMAGTRDAQGNYSGFVGLLQRDVSSSKPNCVT